MNDMSGHNLPADPAAPIRADLEERFRAILDRSADLLSAAERVPAAVEDDETAGRIGDFIKQVTGCIKASEIARTSAKEPHLAAGRAVDGFFKGISDPLDKAKRSIESRLTTWLRKKEAAERAAREEAARVEREAAEKARREALAAEEAITNAKTLGEALEAEDRARKATADAQAAQKAAEVKPAELSRSRGDLGSVASLRSFWDFADLDRPTLDLETLRNHLPLEALEKAVRSFVKAGGRELRGARIYENTQAAVR